mmetsp:Transcript_5056/g.14766  ORF Transcript_5056/g.14766 Transcript_5056/m.14766 type:complete len:640 (+) Transcript_5056:249-2168(+)
MQNSMWKNGRRGGMMEDGTQGGNQLPFQLNDAAPANNGTSTGPMMIMPTSGDNGGIDQFALRQNTNGTAYHHEDDQKIASSNINGNTSEGMTGVPPMFFGTTNCFFESSVPQPAPPSSGDRGATGDARMWHASSSAAGQHSSSSASSARPSASSSSAARLQASLQAMSNSTPSISSSAASRPRKNASWPRAASCSFPLPSATRGRGNRSNRRSSDEDRRRMGGDFSDLPAVMSNAAVLRGDGMVATTNPQVPAGASGIDGLNDNSSYVSSSPGSSQQPTHILQQQLQAQLQSQLRQLELKQQKLLLEQQLQIQRMKIEQMEANMQVQQQQHQNHFGLDGSLQSQQGGMLPYASNANCGGNVGWTQQPRRSTGCASVASTAASSTAAGSSSYQASGSSVYSSTHSEQSGYEQVLDITAGGAGDDDDLSSIFGFGSFIMIDPSIPGEVDLPEEQNARNSKERKEPGSASRPPASAGDARSSPSPPRVKTTHIEKWNLRYRDLLNFKEQFGHCLVPLESPENPPLAHWVKRQRCQWKLRSKGKKSTLTDHRFELLDDLGFVWDAHQAAWQFRLVQLRQFARVHGHANVPSRYAPNQSLAVWSKCQRRMKRMHDAGGRSSLTAERIAELTSIGFAWDIRNPPP